MAGGEVVTGLKSPYLQFVSLNGLAGYDLGQIVTEGIVPDDSDHPMFICIRNRIAGPLDEFQKVEQERSFHLVLSGSFLRVNTLEWRCPTPSQQHDSVCESRADPVRPTLERAEFRVVVKSHRPRDRCLDRP